MLQEVQSFVVILGGTDHSIRPLLLSRRGMSHQLSCRTTWTLLRHVLYRATARSGFFGLSFTCRTTDYSTFTLYADFEWWTKYFERLVYIATIFAKEFCPVLHDNEFVFFSKVSLFFMHLSPYAISFVDKNLHKLQEILKNSFEAQFKPLNYCMWRQPNCFMLNLIQPALRGSNCVMLKR